MENGQPKPLSQAAKIRLPNVDEVMDLGYAMHASDDPALFDTEARKLACQIMQEFRSLRAEPGNDTEAGYLACARGIVLAHGGAIRRRKREWKDALEGAKREREQSLERMQESSKHYAWYLTLLWKLMPPAVLVLTGIVVAQTSDKLPDDMTKTLTWLISFAVGGAFALVGRYIGIWWRDTKRNAVEVKYNSDLFQAHITYEKGKAKEHRYFREPMCEAWETYTGEKFPATASYELVMAGDIEDREVMERQRQKYNRATVWLLRRLARLLRGRKKGEAESPGEFAKPSLQEL